MHVSITGSAHCDGAAFGFEEDVWSAPVRAAYQHIIRTGKSVADWRRDLRFWAAAMNRPHRTRIGGYSGPE